MSKKLSNKTLSNKKRWTIGSFSAVALLAAALLAAILTFNSPGGRLTAEADSGARAPAASHPLTEPPSPLAVTVLSTAPRTARSEVRSYGEAKARYRTVVRAEVSGALISIAPKAHSGHWVRQGTVLMKLDDSRLVEALARTEADLGRARVELAEENLRAQQAAADWHRIGNGEPASEFLLRTPQRSSAELEVAAAEAAVVEARKNLNRAVIRAPFDAVVVRRIASLGSYLQAGADLMELDSSESVEVRLSLGPAEWSLLPSPSELIKSGRSVALTGSDSSASAWLGKVSRIEQHVEGDSRQRSLVVTVPDPLNLDPPLFPGTFVRATLPGRELSRVLDLPASAVTEKKEIWLVDDKGQLARAPVEPLWVAADRVFVHPPAPFDAAAEFDVLVHPMASYLSGMPVRKQVDHGSH